MSIWRKFSSAKTDSTPVTGGASDSVFDQRTYDGTAGTQSIVNGIDLQTHGGMVWIKGNALSHAHYFFDTERGLSDSVEGAKWWSTYTGGSVGNHYRVGVGAHTSTLTSFNNNGFTIGDWSEINTGGALSGYQNRPVTYMAYTFRRAPKFFDVVTWTGDGNTTNRNILHNLQCTPGLIFVKNITDRTSNNRWTIWCNSFGLGNSYFAGNPNSSAVNDYIQPESYGAVYAATVTVQHGTNFWGTSAPNDYKFSIRDSGGTGVDDRVALALNKLNDKYVAYLWANDVDINGNSNANSVIRCSYYNGTGTHSPGGGGALGAGWEPQFVFCQPLRFNATAGTYNTTVRAGEDGGPYVWDIVRGLPHNSARSNTSVGALNTYTNAGSRVAGDVQSFNMRYNGRSEGITNDGAPAISADGLNMGDENSTDSHQSFNAFNTHYFAMVIKRPDNVPTTGHSVIYVQDALQPSSQAREASNNTGTTVGAYINGNSSTGQLNNSSPGTTPVDHQQYADTHWWTARDNLGPRQFSWMDRIRGRNYHVGNVDPQPNPNHGNYEQVPLHPDSLPFGVRGSAGGAYATRFAPEKGSTDGVYSGMFNIHGYTGTGRPQYYKHYLWARAKGVYECTTYVGDGSNSGARRHNLGVKPEMIIIKKQNTHRYGDRGADGSSGGNGQPYGNTSYYNGPVNNYTPEKTWRMWHKDWKTMAGATSSTSDTGFYGSLESSLVLGHPYATGDANDGMFPSYETLTGDNTTSSSPTTHFYLGPQNGLNGDGNDTYNKGKYINQLHEYYTVWMWASKPGISKVGTYDGDGTSDGSHVIDCGFTNGARFVMIGVWNQPAISSSGTLPVLLFSKGSNRDNTPYSVAGVNTYEYGYTFITRNTSVVNLTASDRLDRHNSGFIVKGGSTGDVNKGPFNYGGTQTKCSYWYLAIAD